MAPKIVPLIPPHLVYCEPFAGGASVFYAKPQFTPANNNHYREVLNDMNGDLVNMYREAKSQPDDFARNINSIPFSAAIFRGCAVKSLDRKERALATYVSYQQSFCHQGSISGWARGTYGGNWAATNQRAGARSKEAAARLDSVHLDSIDALECIKKWDSPHTFFYIDPPYVGTRIDGMGKWGQENLAELADLLNSCKGSFMLSEYNVGLACLRHTLKIEFRTHCTADAGKKTGKGRNHGEPVKATTKAERTERLWMRGPAHPVRTSLIAVLEKQKIFSGPLLGPVPLPLKDHTMSKEARSLLSEEMNVDA